MNKMSILPILFLLILPAFSLSAQEADNDEREPQYPIIEAEIDDFSMFYYARGDKTFIITMGLLVPTIFEGTGMDKSGGHNIKNGGTGSLAYNYFIGPNFFIGGELGGMFAGTIGGNMLYIVPFGMRFGHQLIINRFEIPFTMMVGAAPQRYRESEGFFGLIVKPAVSGFFRFNNDWSFGMNAQWWMLPQWPKKDDSFVLGNFLELTLSARYHF